METNHSPTCATAVSLPEEDRIKLEHWKTFPKYNAITTFLSRCRIGTRIPGTNITPCKVFMMDKKWDGHIEPAEAHCLLDLVKTYRSEGKPPIRVIVNLSTSVDYYNFAEVKKESPDYVGDIEYFHFPLSSKAVPSEASLNEIYEVLASHQSEEYTVLVHCVNGVNRTGFVVSYFISRYLGKTSKEAYEIFAAARGHTMDNSLFSDNLVILDRIKKPTA